MKGRVVLIIVLVLMVLSACGSTTHCDAYGNNSGVEQHNDETTRQEQSGYGCCDVCGNTFPQKRTETPKERYKPIQERVRMVV